MRRENARHGQGQLEPARESVPGPGLESRSCREADGGARGRNLFNEFDTGDRIGTAITVLGDLDGEGSPDATVSARRDDDAGTDTGAVYVLHTATPLPEPGALLGLASGCLLLAALKRRRASVAEVSSR
jgi:hypothetical protein